MIDYFSVVNETFEDSHMWQKARLILLVYYLYQQEIKNRLDYRIGYVNLFVPPEQDIKIIAHDFAVIVEKNQKMEKLMNYLKGILCIWEQHQRQQRQGTGESSRLVLN